MSAGSSSSWPFGALKPFGYRAILADPPWSFDNWSAKGEAKNAKRHYACMSVEAIKSLPVGHLAHGEGCALFCWVTDPLLHRAFEVIETWGFAYLTVAFTWVKTTSRGGRHFGTGYWTRANPEICLLAACGHPKRLSAGVAQLLETVHEEGDAIFAPLREHSRKPDEVRERIERLVSGPYAELFARQQRPGWDAWGNETEKFSQLRPTGFVGQAGEDSAEEGAA